MTDPADRDTQHDLSSPLRCASCSARLAHDQRYCIECGKRRGALPAKVSELIAAILERGKSQVPIPSGPARRLLSVPVNWMPTTQTIAIAVMGMLAFGVAIGSATSTGVGGIGGGRSPLIVFRAPSPAAAAPPATTASNTGGGGRGTGGGSSSKSSSSTSNSNGNNSGSGNNTGGSGNNASANSNPFALPPIKHVFLIVLSGLGWTQSFGSTNTYFSKTLPKQGELFQHYYGIAGSSLANGIALISGQGPTPETVANCPVFKRFEPATKGRNDQFLGTGCVYPAKTETLATELTAKHDTWKAYLQGLDTPVHGQASACRHPMVGGADAEQMPTAKDPYVTWQNPYVYFEADLKGSACKHDDGGLKQLAADLKATSTTPNFSYIVPDPCDNGSPQPCVPGAKSGIAAAQAFLEKVVPEVEGSPAYKADGLLIITFDQAPQTGPNADSSTCCVTITYPNLPPPPTTTTTTTPTTATTPTTPTTPTTATPTTTTTTTPNPLAPLEKLLRLQTTTTTTTTTTAPPAPTTTSTASTAPPPATTTTTTTATATSPPTGTTTTTTTTTAPGGTANGASPGGGEVGLLLISQYVKKGSSDLVDPYDHFALLASIENLFGLKLLGYAGFSGLPTFVRSTYNNYFG